MARNLFGGNKEVEEDQPVANEAVVTDADAAEKLKAQKKAAADKMKARKTAALEKLIDLAMRMGNDEEKEAAVYMQPGRHTSGATASGPKTPKVKADLVKEIFSDNDEMHEDDVYLKFKLGRTEMRKVIQQGVNNNVWITFDLGTGLYKVVSRSEMPDGWLGPQPKTPKVL